MEWSKKWFEDYKGTSREGVSLRSYSNLKIGGPAALFLEPWAEEDAAVAIRICLEHGLPYRILGAGSNVVLPDEGLDEVVFHIGHWNRVVRDGERLIASAGKSLPSLIRQAKECKLGGLEFLAGIPAQVGGAVFMNAGTHEAETCDLLHSVRIIDESGELREIERKDMEPTYRSGGFGQVMITTATFALEERPEEEIKQNLETLLKRRAATQPVSARSVGCIFKNPPGDAAGRLIQAAGLKGERIGDIEVSSRHANYFVNLGKGTSQQLIKLIQKVQDRVFEESGIRLEPEVQIWRNR